MGKNYLGKWKERAILVFYLEVLCQDDENGQIWLLTKINSILLLFEKYLAIYYII